MDIDDFKGINDTYGHSYGDRVIRCVGQTLLSTFRSSDIVYRLGGDEFAVFMQAQKIDSVVETKAEALMDNIANVAHTIGLEHPFTLSVGIATTQTTDAIFENLYNAADGELYNVKRAGKGSFGIKRS